MNNNTFQYNGTDITFLSGNGDVMANATQMSKCFNKQPSDWLRLKSTEKFLSELEGGRGIPRCHLIRVINDGINNGTWMHEDVALEFARWLAPAFSIWCNDKIKEIIKNGFSTIKPLSELEILAKSVSILQQHESRISNIELKVNQVLAIQDEAQKEMLSLPLSTDSVPEMSLRDKIRALVNKYSVRFSVSQKEVWDRIYQTLYYNYHIALRSYARKKSESLMDVAERVGALEKMFAIISNMAKQNGLVA
jgi:hypothetical protein